MTVLQAQDKASMACKVSPEVAAKTAQEESEALMKKLDEDIARVLDLESPPEADHNADKRDTVKHSGTW